MNRWKQVGLLSDLPLPETVRLLSTKANDQGPPSPSLLHHYYFADGDPVESLWRRQSDGYVEVPTGASFTQAARALEESMPGLGPLRTSINGAALLIHSGTDVATVSRYVRHARVPGRRLRQSLYQARHVVRGVNAILAHRGSHRRFVELRAGSERHVFVAIDTRQARELFEWGAIRESDLSALRAFAGWDRGRRRRAG